MAARLIAIEGIDQSGKHTQTRLLAKTLREKHFKVKTISFPIYDSRSGRQLREFLEGRTSYPPQMIHMLYSLNRWENLEKIRLIMKHSDYLIMDRYSPSNIAYGVAKGLDRQWLTILEKGLPIADLVIVLDVPVSSSFTRKLDKRDVHEKDRHYLAKVKQSYKTLARQFGWKLVDANASADETHERVWKEVRAKFHLRQ